MSGQQQHDQQEQRPRVLNMRHIPNLRPWMSGPSLANAVYVGRPSKWGNPFSIQKYGREECLRRFRTYVAGRPDLQADARRELRGMDLICWCAPLPCHAETWLEIANEVVK